MSEINELSLIWTAVLSFALMFVCAALSRAKGVIGLLAVVGGLSIAFVVFTDLHDLRLFVGGIAALVGITVGGKVSDYRERMRVARHLDAERQKRDKMSRGGVAKH